MCLGVPGRVVELGDCTAVVDFWGVRKEVRLDIIDEAVVPGDYILNHVGFAIRRIAPEAVAETLALYDTLLREGIDRDSEDLMVTDIQGEIAGTA